MTPDEIWAEAARIAADEDAVDRELEAALATAKIKLAACWGRLRALQERCKHSRMEPHGDECPDCWKSFA